MQTLEQTRAVQERERLHSYRSRCVQTFATEDVRAGLCCHGQMDGAGCAYKNTSCPSCTWFLNSLTSVWVIELCFVTGLSMQNPSHLRRALQSVLFAPSSAADVTNS